MTNDTKTRFVPWIFCSAVLALTCAGFGAAIARTVPQTPRKENSPCTQSTSTGSSKITVDCRYSTAEHAPDQVAKTEIVLEHASISFDIKADTPLGVELTVRNAGTTFAERRTVYIEFDDEAGRNSIRRPLPHVDLQQLAPGEAKTFTDGFWAPALLPGHYLIRLWIPSPDPKLKFEAAHNFLLGNPGVAEAATGLNHIADMTVKP